VAEELQRIQAREKQTLDDIAKRLAAETSSAPESQSKPTGSSSSSSSTDTIKPSLNLDAPRVPFAGPGSARELASQQQVTTSTEDVPSSPAAAREISSQSVSQEIQALRAKLAERPKVRELDSRVEKAREDVVQCLRGNEKRPLDCWQEVDRFKREVARLERDWVDKVIS
jgi:altered-inheritance-of-mitochondria protein 13